MRVFRANFKYSLRYCKNIENKARADSLAKKFLSKDPIVFWKAIKRINNSNSTLSNTVNGSTGEANIAAMWKTHYSGILNSNKDESYKYKVQSFVEGRSQDEIALDIQDVKDAVSSLSARKCAGPDKLCAEHLLHAGNKLIILLSLLFNAMCKHVFIPSSLMDTVVIPIIKDKRESISDKNNYRPIAITNVISKVLEAIILRQIENKLSTSDNQFGYKRSHGSEMCVFALKQVIEYYKHNNSPVYVCYLDASKAFDRINHWTLYSKLIDRNISVTFVRLLMYWYGNQQFCIRWGSTYSNYFFVSNGVRQGGILSPILFCVYMENLSVALNKSGIGCIMNGTPINHLLYADDTCILAPSATALQRLLNICTEYAKTNSILFNETKTKCMYFKTKRLSNLYVPQLRLDGNCLKWVDNCKYLGIQIENGCNDDLDINRHVRGLYARGNLMINRFRNCSEDVKICLFKSYFTSLYGGALWNRYKKASLKKAKVAYNDIFRGLFNIMRGVSVSMLYMFCGIDGFDVLVRKNVFSFQQRLKKTVNTIIKSIISSQFHDTSPLSKKWQDILYI